MIEDRWGPYRSSCFQRCLLCGLVAAGRPWRERKEGSSSSKRWMRASGCCLEVRQIPVPCESVQELVGPKNQPWKLCRRITEIKAPLRVCPRANTK